MAGLESNIGVDIPATIDQRLDARRVTQPVSGNAVDREVVVLADPVGVDDIARVLAGNPAGADLALIVQSKRGFAAGTPEFTDPIDRALRDLGKVDIAAFDAALPTGANTIGAVDVTDRAARLTGQTEIRKASTANAPAQTAQETTSAQILAVNTARRGLMIINTGITVIKLTLGGTAVTQTAYHIVLKAASAADDGTGGIYVDDQWTGAVQAISSAAGGTLVILEIT